MSADSQNSGDNQVVEVSSEGGETAPAGESAVVATPGRRLSWYALHTQSGCEARAKQALEERIRTSKMGEQFGEVRIPQETVVELVKGQKKTSTRKSLPGYLFVQMNLNEDTWHLVRQTPKITGFVGSATDPSPMTDDEVSRMLSAEEGGTTAPRTKAKFKEGETVKVVDGPFSEFTGSIEEVNAAKGKVKVLITIFGRATPVELDFVQVEKV